MIGKLLPILKFRIEGNSMYPLFSSGQDVLVNKLSYIFRKPKIGDVIVLRHKKDKRYIIKRIVKIHKDQYFVEGENKKESTDSRQFGWISKDNIVGKVIL